MPAFIAVDSELERCLRRLRHVASSVKRCGCCCTRTRFATRVHSARMPKENPRKTPRRLPTCPSPPARSVSMKSSSLRRSNASPWLRQLGKHAQAIQMQTRCKLRNEHKLPDRPRCTSLGVDVVVCAFVDNAFRACITGILGKRLPIPNNAKNRRRLYGSC